MICSLHALLLSLALASYSLLSTALDSDTAESSTWAYLPSLSQHRPCVRQSGTIIQCQFTGLHTHPSLIQACGDPLPWGLPTWKFWSSSAGRSVPAARDSVRVRRRGPPPHQPPHYSSDNRQPANPNPTAVIIAGHLIIRQHDVEPTRRRGGSYSKPGQDSKPRPHASHDYLQSPP